MIAYQQIRQYSQLNNRLTMVIQSTRPEHELKIHITYIKKNSLLVHSYSNRLFLLYPRFANSFL